MATSTLELTVGRSSNRYGYNTFSFFGGNYGIKTNDSKNIVACLLSFGGRFYLFVKSSEFPTGTRLQISRGANTATLNRGSNFIQGGQTLFQFVGDAVSSVLSASDLNTKIKLNFNLDGQAVNVFDDLVVATPELEDWNEVFLGTLPYVQIHLGETLYWDGADAGSNRPAILSFSASNLTPNLDTSGTITLSFRVSASTRNTITRLDTNANVPLTTSTTAVIPKPDGPVTFRLSASNTHGTTVQDVRVIPTKTMSIVSFMRTRYTSIGLNGLGGTTLFFSARVTGLPQPENPVVRVYHTSDGRILNTLNFSRATAVNGNTWDYSGSVTIAHRTPSNAYAILSVFQRATNRTVTQRLNNVRG